MNMRSIFKRIFAVVLFAMLIGGTTQMVTTPAIAAEDLNQKILSNQMVQKVNAFEVIIDATESMNEIYKGGTKFNQERTLINLLNDTIPDLKLKIAARMFGQFGAFAEPTSQSRVGLVDYEKSVLRQIIAPNPTGMGFSPLDNAIDGATGDLRSQSGQLAVIAFSDGEDMDKYTPVKAAERLKSVYGDRICIYTVHLGENVAGRKLMQQVADAGGCGFMVKGDDIATPAGMADFVEKVFLKAYVAPPRPVVVQPIKEEPKPVVKEEPKPKEVVAEVKAPAQAAPAVVKEPFLILLNVQFDTGKSAIKAKYHNEIKRAADYMIEHPDTKAVIEGHTDNVGKEAANVKLSQKRANAVKKYLISKFKIDASRLEAIGYGPNKPVASNATKKGKQENRRVTALFSDK